MGNKAETYDYYTDPESGKLFGIDTATGEQFGASHIIVPDGSWIITPEEQDRYKRLAEARQNNKLRRSISKELGSYIFIPSCEQFKDLSPCNLARLVYLSTFTNYDGKLMHTQRRPILKDDLCRLLRLSKSQTIRFFDDVSPQYLTMSDDNGIHINRQIFVKGSIEADRRHRSYKKVFVNGVQRIYKSTPKNKHKQLGYVFQLLQYINIEYNLICFNPCETKLEMIELISVADFCKLIDYDINHWNKLLSSYNDITFDVNGKEERLFSFVYDGVYNQNAKICVNPHILYSGTDYHKVEVLGAFFA